MPSFKTLKEAEQYGVKNYFTPRIRRTNQGNWNVRDEWDTKVFDEWDENNHQ